jgi:hypothetical protein
MASVMYLYFSTQEEDILEHASAKCQLCIKLVNLHAIVWHLGIHNITLSNIPMPNY